MYNNHQDLQRRGIGEVERKEEKRKTLFIRWEREASSIWRESHYYERPEKDQSDPKEEKKRDDEKGNSEEHQ